jgi:hypothetical protein
VQERLTITVPSNNKWHTEDLEKKAEELGISKGDFLLMAVDMLMTFDNDFIKKIQSHSRGLNIPMGVFIQNTLIKELAKDAARIETGVWKSKPLDEFRFVKDGDNYRVVTGDELFHELKEQYVMEIERKGTIK